jgi:hypothetical protein
MVYQAGEYISVAAVMPLGLGPACCRNPVGILFFLESDPAN